MILKKKRKKQKALVDLDRGIVQFENFQFIHKFVGNETIDVVELPFIEVLESERWKYRGERYFNIWTSRGKVTLDPEDCQDFESLQTDIETIVESNQKELPDYKERLKRIPKPKTPWWGWVILLVGSFIVIYVSWKTYF